MNSLKILIIDDEKSLRVLLGKILSKHSTEILELDNGQNAMKVVDSQSPDLVITDLVMPEKDGLEVIWETKEKHPTLPIFAMSAYHEYIDFASDMGADEIFIKPIDTDRLIKCIQKLSAPLLQTT